MAEQAARHKARCGKTTVGQPCHCLFFLGQRRQIRKIELYHLQDLQVEQEHQAVLQDMERVRLKLILGDGQRVKQ